MDGWSDRDQYGESNIKRQQVYGVYRDGAVGYSAKAHSLVGYFRTKEEAQRVINTLDGLRKAEPGRWFYKHETVELRIFNSYSEWENEQRDIERAKVLAKLTPAERKVLGF